MKIPAYAIRIILFLVFLSAAGVRFASTSASLYPYFPGQSAMNYRDALIVAGGGEGAGLDRLTHKSNWPQGYRPARVRPAGVEHFAGGVIRTAKWLSDNDSRTITRRLVVFFFSLCVFTLFTLTRNLWGSQAAGLTAAAMVAMFPPLVEATNGREFGHTSFALVVVTLHLLSLQRLARAGGRKDLSMTIGATGAGISSFALMAGWELAPWYLAGVTAVATLLYPFGDRQRRVIAVTHFAAFAVAALAVPWASASRMLFSWQAALLVACCARTFLPGRLWAGRTRGAIFVGAATVVLTRRDLRRSRHRRTHGPVDAAAGGRRVVGTSGTRVRVVPVAVSLRTAVRSGSAAGRSPRPVVVGSRHPRRTLVDRVFSAPVVPRFRGGRRRRATRRAVRRGERRLRAPPERSPRPPWPHSGW